MYSLAESSNSDGKELHLWSMGTLTYSIVVMVANMTILYASNTHTVFNVTIVTLSILSFFVIWWLENMFQFFAVMQGIFVPAMTTMIVYFLLFMASFGLFPIDKVINWSIF
jgi:hypothetical protein